MSHANNIEASVVNISKRMWRLANQKFVISSARLAALLSQGWNILAEIIARMRLQQQSRSAKRSGLSHLIDIYVHAVLVTKLLSFLHHAKPCASLLLKSTAVTLPPRISILRPMRSECDQVARFNRRHRRGTCSLLFSYSLRRGLVQIFAKRSLRPTNRPRERPPKHQTCDRRA